MNTLKTKLSTLPSPKGKFLTGHLPAFNVPNKHQVLEKWVEECGDLFRINFVGKQFIVSADPDLNDQILKLRPDKFRRFNKIKSVLEEMGIIGVFNAEGETWRRHRKPTAESLSLKQVRSFYPIIAEKTILLLNKWDKYAFNKSPIDVQKEFMKYTVDITTEIAFGYKLDTINDEKNAFQHHMERIFPMINHRITAPIPTWRLIKQKKDKELEASIKKIEELIYTFIAKAKQRLETNPTLKENPSNFLEALLVEKETEQNFSDKEIYGNVFSILLAGEDTTSNSISWALFYLAQHPEIIESVRKEAYSIYGDHKLPTSDKELTQLKLANAVAQEAIRLKPVTPNLYMEANENLVLNDLEIPKGTIFMLQNKVAQTKEEHFSNANTFIPERWLRGGCPMHDNHKPEMIKAFGGGLRFCPGKNLAMHEMTMIISTLCKSYNLELLVRPEEVTEQFQFTMYPENLLMKIIKAN